MRAAFVTHTLSSFVDRDLLEKYNVYEIPMETTDGEERFLDDGPVRVDETYHALHTALARGEARGSPPPSEVYRSQFEAALAENDAVYEFLPGEELMGSASANVAKQQADEGDHIRVWQHDTMPPAGSLLAALSSRAVPNANDFEKLETLIDGLVERVTGVLVVPRFNDMVGVMTNVETYRDRPFEIYPVVTGGEGGAVVPITAVCTLEQVYDVIVRFVEREVVDETDGDGAAYAVMEMLAEPAAEGLRQRLREAIPAAEEIGRLRPGLAFGTVVGRGAFGVAVCPSVPEVDT